MQTFGERLDRFFDSMKDSDIERYTDYWKSVEPTNKEDIFRRYLFAFMSVHTSWQNNCKGYNAIKRYEKWKGNKARLLQKIERTRVGLQNNRANFISSFSSAYWDKPSRFISPSANQGWSEWRDKLCKKITGLGEAKTSFAIEMIYPTDAKVVCLDTHLFQLYGLNQTKHRKLYRAIEIDWLTRCKEREVPSYIARCLYWDKKQKRKNSRYWSKVLEA